MKTSKIATCQIALLAIAFCVNGIYCLNFLKKYANYSNNWRCDLFYRYHEIVCMHEGIDPFDIFERKITSKKYIGYERPDKPNGPVNGRRIVHAYPAWHAALFWWYGYVHKWACLAVMASLYFCILFLVSRWTFHNMIVNNFHEHVINILFLFIILLYSLVGIYCSLNYGLLLLGCTLLLCKTLERGYDMLAGLIYSIIMIKPQVGLLLIFPLFFNRKYKTIILAAFICFFETCFTAYMLNKSPIELILQIPQIGAPFGKGFLAENIMKIIGPFGQYINMGIFMSLAAAGSYLTRNAKEIWMRFIPAIAFVPFWTYSQPHDWLVTLPCYVYILNSKDKYPRIFTFCIFAAFLRSFMLYAHSIKFYSLGKAGIAVGLHLALALVCCLMVILDAEGNEPIHNLVSKLASFTGKTQPK